MSLDFLLFDADIVSIWEFWGEHLKNQFGKRSGSDLEFRGGCIMLVSKMKRFGIRRGSYVLIP